MEKIIFETTEAVLLVGAGECRPDDLREVLAVIPRLVAADGGAEHALMIDAVPEAIVGDFDSFPSEMHSKIPENRLHHVAEQDSIDFEKALARISAPLVLGVGFLGQRVDHQLAAFNVLMRRAHQRCLLIGSEQVVFLCPPEIDFSSQVGGLVSVFPLVPIVAESCGLHWPLDGLDLAPDRLISTSNKAAQNHIHIKVNMPGLLVMLPRSEWRYVHQTLMRTPAQWPVP